MPPNALPAGHSLQGYRIEKVLGAGGFGLTYLAVDPKVNLKVALKEYLPADIAQRAANRSITPRSPEAAGSFGAARQRFLDESRAVASFRHPNIVRVLRFFEANGTAYLAMEFVEGAALGDWAKARAPLNEAELVPIILPLLDGLEAVHAAGLLHRDIKPANICVRHDGSPVLLDFGLARPKATGSWSDIYALAGVLYWMVVGAMPPEAAARIPSDHMAPAVLAGDRTRYRPEFLAAIDWALSPIDDERPHTIAEWREALLGNKPVAARPMQPKPVEMKTEKPASKTAASRPLPLDVLVRAQEHLAEYIGPVASVVVKRAAAKARDQAELYLLLADEIEDKDEKKAFIRRAISTTGKA